MISTSSLRTLFHAVSHRPQHHEAPAPQELTVPGRIDDPATTAGVALSLCRSRWDELTIVLYMDAQERFVGHAVVASGWVQEGLLSARPILAGSEACQGTSCILVRHRHYGPCSPSETEDRSFRSIAAACSRYAFPVVDHLVVVGSGAFSSGFLGCPKVRPPPRDTPTPYHQIMGFRRLN